MSEKHADICKPALKNTIKSQVQWKLILLNVPPPFLTTMWRSPRQQLVEKTNYVVRTLEALHIREQKSSLNTKDEYKRKELTIKL